MGVADGVPFHFVALCIGGRLFFQEDDEEAIRFHLVVFCTSTDSRCLPTPESQCEWTTYPRQPTMSHAGHTVLGVALICGAIVLVFEGKTWMRWLAGAFLGLVILTPLLHLAFYRPHRVDAETAMRCLEEDIGGSLPSSVRVTGFSVPHNDPREYVVHFVVSSNDCEVISEMVRSRARGDQSIGESSTHQRTLDRAEERCREALKNARILRANLDRTVILDGERGRAVVMWVDRSRRWAMIWCWRTTGPTPRLSNKDNRGGEASL